MGPMISDSISEVTLIPKTSLMCHKQGGLIIEVFNNWIVAITAILQLA